MLFVVQTRLIQNLDIPTAIVPSTAHSNWSRKIFKEVSGQWKALMVHIPGLDDRSCRLLSVRLCRDL